MREYGFAACAMYEPKTGLERQSLSRYVQLPPPSEIAVERILFVLGELFLHQQPGEVGSADDRTAGELQKLLVVHRYTGLTGGGYDAKIALGAHPLKLGEQTNRVRSEVPQSEAE